MAKQHSGWLRKTCLRQDREILRAISTQMQPVSEILRNLAFTIMISTSNPHIQIKKIRKYRRMCGHLCWKCITETHAFFKLKNNSLDGSIVKCFFNNGNQFNLDALMARHSVAMIYYDNFSSCLVEKKEDRAGGGHSWCKTHCVSIQQWILFFIMVDSSLRIIKMSIIATCFHLETSYFLDF